MIVPVILSGGSGTRLWPLSRASFPKQFLAIGKGRSLLQETALRVADEDFTAPVCVSNEQQRFLVAHHLLEAGRPPAKILLEPNSRNTGPAIAAACLYLLPDGDPLVLILPADHVIADVTAFHEGVAAGVEHAEAGSLVTFGIRPDRAHTGYGYIEAGRRIEGSRAEPAGYAVQRFVEKPDQRTAADYVKSGTHYWNSGIFLFRASVFLRELETLAPEMLQACRDAVEGGSHDGDFFRLEAKAFGRAPALAVDYAVMEKTDTAVMVPVDMGWSDVGSWSALWELAEKDASGNVVEGDALLEEVKDTYIRSEGPLVTGIGLSKMVVVATEDAVLVAPKERAQEMLVLMDAPVFPGCVVLSRPVGVIEAEQTEDGQTERNDRLLAVAANSATHRSINELGDLSRDLVAQVEHFFVSYNEARGKRFEIKGHGGKRRALALVKTAMKRAR